MSLLQQPLERKLSALLGTPVTFGQFKLSLLKGSVEVLNVTVAGDDPAHPLLTIRRLFAEISIARAMKKEIVIKSLAIERPALALRRRSDGTLNLPRRLDSNRPKPAEGADEPPPPVLEAQKVLLVDGAVSYHDETRAGSSYHAAVEGIQASLQQAGPSLTLTLLAAALGRRDPLVELGPVRASATFTGASHLGQLLQASLSAEATLGDSLRLAVQSSRMETQSLEATLSGPIHLATLAALLPPDLLDFAPGITGEVELNAKARYSPAQGVQIPAADMRITNAALRRRGSTAEALPPPGTEH